MLINLFFFILSIVPSVLIVIWLRNRKKHNTLYLQSCKSAIIRGTICVMPILIVSATFHLARNLLIRFIFPDMNALVSQAIYTFIVLAFSEELVKYIMFRHLLRKNISNYSLADITAFMVIIGTVFGLVEDIPYAIGATPSIMLIRGLTMGHVGYGFIMGWFYGKHIETSKKIYGIVAFGLPLFIHGLYDFSLSEELLKTNDNLAFIGLSLAVLDVVLIILMIRFFLISRKKERYTDQLIEKTIEVRCSSKTMSVCHENTSFH